MQLMSLSWKPDKVVLQAEGIDSESIFS